MTDRLRGRAEIRVTGAEIWRFLDRCSRAGIRLEAVQAMDELTCTAMIRTKDLSRAEKLAERSSCTLEVLRIRGAAGAVRLLRRRKALLLLCLVLTAALCVSGLFVWDIRVAVNDSQLSDGEILRALARQGVGVGSFWPAFRGERIRTRALLALPELSFLAVNVRAGRAEVTARAAVPPPEIWDSGRPGNVTAARSGIVASIVVLAGEERVRRGEAVTAGQVLIAGTAADPHARGEVRAYTYYEFTAAAPLTRWEKAYGGPVRRRLALTVGERRINIFPGSGILPPGCDKMTKERRLGVKNGFSLPLKWITEEWRPYTLTRVEADREELEHLLEARLFRQLSAALEGRGEATRTHMTSAAAGDLLTLTLRAECLERIDLDDPGED